MQIDIFVMHIFFRLTSQTTTDCTKQHINQHLFLSCYAAPIKTHKLNLNVQLLSQILPLNGHPNCMFSLLASTIVALHDSWFKIIFISITGLWGFSFSPFNHTLLANRGSKCICALM